MIINGDSGCRLLQPTGRLTAQVGWLCLRVGSRCRGWHGVCIHCSELLRWLFHIISVSLRQSLYSVSQKNTPYGYLKFFPKRLGIFNQFFTHLLYDHFYTRLQIFIQISPTLTKLCHTKRDHLAFFLHFTRTTPYPDKNAPPPQKKHLSK